MKILTEWSTQKSHQSNTEIGTIQYYWLYQSLIVPFCTKRKLSDAVEKSILKSKEEDLESQ